MNLTLLPSHPDLDPVSLLSPKSCDPAELTWFEQEDLVVLAQLHEPWDALGKLHHILDGVGDLDGTLLPQHIPRLPAESTQFRANNGCLWHTHTHSHDLDPHLALVHLDLFVWVRLPSQLLQLIRCVLTRLQVGLDYILSDSVWKTQNISPLFYALVWWVRACVGQDKRAHPCARCSVQCTTTPLSDWEASRGRAFFRRRSFTA